MNPAGRERKYEQNDQIQTGIHAGRNAGGHLDYRDSGGVVAARAERLESRREAGDLPEQFETNQLCGPAVL